MYSIRLQHCHARPDLALSASQPKWPACSWHERVVAREDVLIESVRRYVQQNVSVLAVVDERK
jgi:hypothetical protein